MQNEDILEIPIDESYFKRLQELKKKYSVQYFNARFGVKSATILEINKEKMKQTHKFNDYGFSIQAFINGGWSFVYANDINLNLLEDKFEQAYKLAKFASTKSDKPFKIDELDPINVKIAQKQKINFLDINEEEKVKFLIEQDKKALDFDARIVNTMSMYSDTLSHQIIYTSDERIVDLTESYGRVYIKANSREGSINQSARATQGITGGYEFTKQATEIGAEAAKKAIEMLGAKMIKGGVYNTICDPFLGGTFAHESFGHAMEADSVLAGESQLKGMIGEKVGNENITIIDSPHFGRFYGSIMYDSEGILAKDTTLIENGVLKNYMHTRETASKMEEEPTGNGRAQSFKSIPQARMTTTYIKEGDLTLEEMIEDMKDGLLCISWGASYTLPNTGQFVFNTERAWKIKNGEKVQLIRDAALTGTMLEVLHKINAISKNKKFDDGVCGKGGQRVPVSSGSPYISMKDITIGGA